MSLRKTGTSPPLKHETILLATVLGLASGCKHRDVSAAHPAVASDSARKYPHGRWRLVGPAELLKSVVWVSHILVRHRDSQMGEYWLRVGGWAPDKAPTRSREEALKLAERLGAAVRADPTSFAKVARESSDDVASARRGGSLGGVRAVRLPAALLDALAALEPGQISAVVETPMGFHILLKRTPPVSEDLSGARVVVRYASTLGENPSTRSRDEAWQRALAIVAQARSGADFAALAREQSDNPDRIRGGALGVWASREPTPDNSALVEALQELAVGRVSEPIDSQLGFQVIKRLPLSPATEFAMREIRIPIEEAPDGALAEARAILATLRPNPENFSSRLRDRCCRFPERWTDGHGDPVVTNALEQLRLGEFTPLPVRVGTYYVIAQRLDPSLVAKPEAPTPGIPSPAAIDLEVAIRGVASARLASGLRELKPLLGSLGLPPKEKSTLEYELDGLGKDLEKADWRSSEARMSAYREHMTKVRAGLSESSYSRTVGAIEGWVSTQFMAEARR